MHVVTKVLGIILVVQMQAVPVVIHQDAWTDSNQNNGKPKLQEMYDGVYNHNKIFQCCQWLS